jgi:hypothetical protein
MDTTEQPAPLMYHEGQPFSRESAAARLAAFDADADRVKAALGGDIAKQQERAAYWSMARGVQPGAVPAMPADGTGVHAQMDEREQQINEARLDTWQKHIRMNDQMRAETKRGLATAEQVEDAKREIRRMLDDPEFGRKVLRGEMDARDKWARFNLLASMQVSPIMLIQNRQRAISFTRCYRAARRVRRNIKICSASLLPGSKAAARSRSRRAPLRSTIR